MIIERIIDILWPKRCVGCGREGLYICKGCEAFLSEIDPMLGSPTAEIFESRAVGLPDIVSVKIVSVWEYEGLMEKLIQKIKFDGCYHIIDELVEKALEKIDLNLPEDTVITFVPMYKRRERQRGFNQSELIARKLASVQATSVHKLLEKVVDNRSQVGLGPKERIENVKDVFRLTSDVNAKTSEVPRNVLLVDDVYTTGATMNECIKVLRKAGVKNIWGFTLSRKMNIQNY